MGESDEAQLFYSFVKSETNHREDPRILWLTGGPGCSAWSGLVSESGIYALAIFVYVFTSQRS